MCVLIEGVENKLLIEKLSSISGSVAGGDEVVILANKIKEGK